ncbi:ferrochelatase [Brevibacterium sp. HMSC24B04]|uniref:ferrochelatase n=1 Tax=Brevibacterium sp. HMSC24B04 TaxID=1581060 RepID=UPI0008A5AE80|nr:ferrochelatase [Brevibacterium sp. HMSC24B04]OFT93118.1 ferrochelatase [Brevibacterium sp. HMSC24B04]
MTSSSVSPFDSIVLMSFGGPNKAEEVVPFLKNVTAGRGIPEERLEEVGEHYFAFGGKSPINEQNIALLEALRKEVSARGIDAPVVWGNRNWDPYLDDVLRERAQAGDSRFIAVTTSAYSSYSSDRQYREDFAKASQKLAGEGINVEIDKIRQYYNHPGFADTQVKIVREALAEFAQKTGGLDPQKHRVLYVTHSIPDAMQAASEKCTIGYEAQHRQLMDYVAAQLGDEQPLEQELVFCSESGPAHIPWSQPDINDRMDELAEEGVTGVVVVPFGFVSDHMEVVYDLDTEAKETADKHGFAFVRAATVGTDPVFVSGLVDLILERAAQVRGEEVSAPAVTEEGALIDGSGAGSVECCRGREDRPTMPNWAD